MIKSIYEALNFTASKDLIYNNKVINEAREIFNSMPLKNIGIKQLIIEQNILEETLAISTAEDSDITFDEVKNIEVSAEIERRLAKYKEDPSLTTEQKYKLLEAENIKNIEVMSDQISFQDLSIDLLRQLHYQLTIGLDEYSKELGIAKYHSGSLRKTNTSKVGDIRPYIPPEYKAIENLLELLFAEFQNLKEISLVNILEFHVLLYAIHPFQNGNKRVARILESMLLNYYGYGADKTLSLSAYYMKNKNGFHQFLMNSLRKRNTTAFVNYAIRGYFFSGHYLFLSAVQNWSSNFKINFEKFIKINVSNKKHKKYKKIPKVILNLECEFTQNEFIEEMHQYNFTTSQSRQILKFLLGNQILIRQKNAYQLPKGIELFSFYKKLAKFMLTNNINPNINESLKS